MASPRRELDATTPLHIARLSSSRRGELCRSRCALTAVKLLERADDLFRGEFAGPLPLVDVPMRYDVIQGEDALRKTLIVYDREAADLPFRHGAQSLVNVIVWLARKYARRGDFFNRNFCGQEVARAHRDADIPIRDDTDELAVGTDDGKHAAVVEP